MASSTEIDCHKDPNFAVICSFIDKYGESLGLPQVSYSDLQNYLQDNTNDVSRVLIDIHVRLLRRIGKSSVTSERFEKSIIKFCHHFSEFDAWEIESYGYKHANIKTKLRLLKNLLECQFDFNLKFKEKVNENDAEQMRFLPIGRDKEGQAYWYFLDKDLNLLIYREEQDDEDADTWELVCSDRQQLKSLVNTLKLDAGKEIKEDDKTSTDSRSSKEGSPDHETTIKKEKDGADNENIKHEKKEIIKEEPVERDKEKDDVIPNDLPESNGKSKKENMTNKGKCDISSNKTELNVCIKSLPEEIVEKHKSGAGEGENQENKNKAASSSSEKPDQVPEDMEKVPKQDLNGQQKICIEETKEAGILNERQQTTAKDNNDLTKAEKESGEDRSQSDISDSVKEIKSTVTSPTEEKSVVDVVTKQKDGMEPNKASEKDLSQGIESLDCEKGKDVSHEVDATKVKDIKKSCDNNEVKGGANESETAERPNKEIVLKESSSLDDKAAEKPNKEIVQKESSSLGDKAAEKPNKEIVVGDSSSIDDKAAEKPNKEIVVGDSSSLGDKAAEKPNKEIVVGDKAAEKPNKEIVVGDSSSLDNKVNDRDSVVDGDGGETQKLANVKSVKERDSDSKTALEITERRETKEENKEGVPSTKEKENEISGQGPKDQPTMASDTPNSIDGKATPTEKDATTGQETTQGEGVSASTILTAGSEKSSTSAKKDKSPDTEKMSSEEKVDTLPANKEDQNKEAGKGKEVENTSNNSSDPSPTTDSKIVNNEPETASDVKDSLHLDPTQSELPKDPDKIEPTGSDDKNVDKDVKASPSHSNVEEDIGETGDDGCEEIEDAVADHKSPVTDENAEKTKSEKGDAELNLEKSCPSADRKVENAANSCSHLQQDSESKEQEVGDDKDLKSLSTEKDENLVEKSGSSANVDREESADSKKVEKCESKDEEKKISEPSSQSAHSKANGSSTLDDDASSKVIDAKETAANTNKDAKESEIVKVDKEKKSMGDGDLKSCEDGGKEDNTQHQDDKNDSVESKSNDELTKDSIDKGKGNKQEVKESDESPKVSNSKMTEENSLLLENSHVREKSSESITESTKEDLIIPNGLKDGDEEKAGTEKANDNDQLSSQKSVEKDKISESNVSEEGKVISEGAKDPHSAKDCVDNKDEKPSEVPVENGISKSSNDEKANSVKSDGECKEISGGKDGKSEVKIEKKDESQDLAAKADEASETKCSSTEDKQFEGEDKTDAKSTKEEQQPSQDTAKGSEAQRTLKRAAPEPASDDLVESGPNGKRARPTARVQKTRGGRNAAARGRATRLAGKESESDDSESVAPVSVRGRGRGRGRGGSRGRGQSIPTSASRQENEADEAAENEADKAAEDEKEEEGSDQASGKRAKKKKPDSSSEALSEEEVTPAKKGRNQIQSKSSTRGTPIARGGSRGGRGRGGAKKPAQVASKAAKEDDNSRRRSVRVKEMKARRPPTPSSPEEESEPTEEDEDEDEFSEPEKVFLEESFTPEEESGDEEFKPMGRNFQRQAARTIKEENEEMVNDDTPCVKCGKYNHPEMILLCDKCDTGHHTACLRPPLMLIPDGDWFCPPCEHSMLVEKLFACLESLDIAYKKRDRLSKRQERLAYVGISINNILHGDRPTPVSENFDTTEDATKKEDDAEEEGGEEDETSEGSSYESEEDVPERSFRSERLTRRQAEKRSRREKHKRRKMSRAPSPDSEMYAKRKCRTRQSVSYQFKEFDEMISNAIDDDQPVRREKPPGRNRGKDMSNILGASDEDEERIKQRDGGEESKSPIAAPVVRKKSKRKLTGLDSDEDDEEEADDDTDEFKLSEDDDSDATEVEGADEGEEEEELSENSDSGDWKPKKTWFSSRNNRSRRGANKFVVEEDEYDSDENATKRRSTRNSTKGRIKYDDWDSEEAEETEQETEEESSFSDFSSDDSNFTRKMKKEKEKRKMKAEKDSKKKAKKKAHDDEEESEGSVSDSSMVRKRKQLMKLVKKRRKDESGSDERELTRVPPKTRGKIRKIKKKEYSDDDSSTVDEDETENEEETDEPRQKKKNVLRSSDEEDDERPASKKAESSGKVMKTLSIALANMGELPSKSLEKSESPPKAKANAKGKKRGEVTNVKMEGKDEPVPGKVRRVSGSDKDGAAEPTATSSPTRKVQPARRGRAASREGPVAEASPEKRGAAAKPARGGRKKKQKLPNFLDVPSGGESDEEGGGAAGYPKQKATGDADQPAVSSFQPVSSGGQQHPPGFPQHPGLYSNQNQGPQQPLNYHMPNQHFGGPPPGAHPQFNPASFARPMMAGAVPPHVRPGLNSPTHSGAAPISSSSSGAGPEGMSPMAQMPPRYTAPPGHASGNSACPTSSAPGAIRGPGPGPYPGYGANVPTSQMMPAQGGMMGMPPHSMMNHQGLEPGQIPPHPSNVRHPQSMQQQQQHHHPQQHPHPHPHHGMGGHHDQQAHPGMMPPQHQQWPPSSMPDPRGQGQGQPQQPAAGYPPGGPRMPYHPRDMGPQRQPYYHPHHQQLRMRSPPPHGGGMGQYPPPGMTPNANPLTSMGQMAQNLSSGIKSPPLKPPTGGEAVGEEGKMSTNPQQQQDQQSSPVKSDVKQEVAEKPREQAPPTSASEVREKKGGGGGKASGKRGKATSPKSQPEKPEADEHGMGGKLPPNPQHAGHTPPHPGQPVSTASMPYHHHHPHQQPHPQQQQAPYMNAPPHQQGFYMPPQHYHHRMPYGGGPPPPSTHPLHDGQQAAGPMTQLMQGMPLPPQHPGQYMGHPGHQQPGLPFPAHASPQQQGPPHRPPYLPPNSTSGGGQNVSSASPQQGQPPQAPNMSGSQSQQPQPTSGAPPPNMADPSNQHQPPPPLVNAAGQQQQQGPPAPGPPIPEGAASGMMPTGPFPHGLPPPPPGMMHGHPRHPYPGMPPPLTGGPPAHNPQQQPPPPQHQASVGGMMPMHPHQGGEVSTPAVVSSLGEPAGSSQGPAVPPPVSGSETQKGPHYPSAIPSSQNQTTGNVPPSSSTSSTASDVKSETLEQQQQQKQTKGESGPKGDDKSQSSLPLGKRRASQDSETLQEQTESSDAEKSVKAGPKSEAQSHSQKPQQQEQTHQAQGQASVPQHSGEAGSNTITSSVSAGSNVPPISHSGAPNNFPPSTMGQQTPGQPGSMPFYGPGPYYHHQSPYGNNMPPPHGQWGPNMNMPPYGHPPRFGGPHGYPVPYGGMPPMMQQQGQSGMPPNNPGGVQQQQQQQQPHPGNPNADTNAVLPTGTPPHSMAAGIPSTPPHPGVPQDLHQSPACVRDRRSSSSDSHSSAPPTSSANAPAQHPDGPPHPVDPVTGSGSSHSHQSQSLPGASPSTSVNNSESTSTVASASLPPPPSSPSSSLPTVATAATTPSSSQLSTTTTVSSSSSPPSSSAPSSVSEQLPTSLPLPPSSSASSDRPKDSHQPPETLPPLPMSGAPPPHPPPNAWTGPNSNAGLQYPLHPMAGGMGPPPPHSPYMPPYGPPPPSHSTHPHHNPYMMANLMQGGVAGGGNPGNKGVQGQGQAYPGGPPMGMPPHQPPPHGMMGQMGPSPHGSPHGYGSQGHPNAHQMPPHPMNYNGGYRQPFGMGPGQPGPLPPTQRPNFNPEMHSGPNVPSDMSQKGEAKTCSSPGDSQTNEGGVVAPKAKRAKTQKKKETNATSSPRGKGTRGRGRGAGGRGGFMIDSLLQAPGKEEEEVEEPGELKDIANYVATDEYIKQQTSS